MMQIFHAPKRILAATGATAVLAMAASFAHAQSEADARAQPATDYPGALAEIVVTAQKRKQSAQHVPISITALTGFQLAQKGLQNTSDLPLAVAGLQISNSADSQLYYLRGVGSQQVGTGIAAEVATFVDGVYMPFPSTALQSFADVESIEVDKGPQGTLFGINATGGVIQIRTKEPKFKPDGEITAGYGNYQHPSGSIYLTGPLSKRIAVSVSMLADDQIDGFGKSLATGKDVDKHSIYAGRVKLLFEASDATTIQLGAHISYARGDAGGTIRPAKGVMLWNQVTNTQMVIPGFYNTDQNTNSFHEATGYGGNIQIHSDFDWGMFKSISALQGYKVNTNVDFDGAPETFLPVLVRQHDRDFTQELQLSSPASSRLIWTVGAFFLKEAGDTSPFEFGAPFPTFALPFTAAPLGDTYQVFAHPKTTSIAGYTQATATVFSNTRLTLGARYTHDTKKISGDGQVAGPSTNPPRVLGFTVGNQTARYGKPTWRIALDHNFTPTVMGYASYNRGFQSGTFNANSVGGFTPEANPPLAPEKIDAYEVGLKSELFDRHFRANLAGFWYDYSNLQQQTYVSGTLVTLNAGAARIKGVDAEFAFQASRQLSVGLTGEYLQAKYTDFANAPGYSYLVGFGSGPLIQAPIPNAAGRYLSFAPKFSGTVYASYELETSVGIFTSSGNVYYNGGYYVEPSNLYKEPNYAVADLTEEWAPDETFALSLYVRNLFNEKYDQTVLANNVLGFVGNTVGAPREYGFTARYRF